MKNKHLARLVMGVCVLFLSVSQASLAASRLVIEDPTTLKFTVQDNRVYLRNLNEYDAAWLPCINYYIDL